VIIETQRGALSVTAKPRDPYGAYSTLAQDTFSGQNVTPQGALALSAVYGAVSLIANACGTMPLEIVDERADGDRRKVSGGRLAAMLRYRPNEDMSGAVLWTLVYAHMLLWGNAYLAKIRNSMGEVVELFPIHPQYVSPYRRAEDGRKTFRVRMMSGTEWIEADYDKRDILHVMGPSFDSGIQGASPIAVMRNTYGRHLAQSEYQSRFFQDGLSIQGAIVTPERLNPDAVARIKQMWRQDHSGAENMWGISVLHSGSQFVPVSMSPEDAQFIETMRWGHTEVATAFNIPASRLNGEGSSLTYANQGQDDLFLFKQTYHPRIVLCEMALNLDDDLFGYTSAWVPRFNTDAALRADVETRFKVYESGRRMKAYSANDVRRMEGMEPREGGDDYDDGATAAESVVGGGSGASD
jgi:HK97 family phage portal protein